MSSWSPDFPRPSCESRDRPAVWSTRNLGVWGGKVKDGAVIPESAERLSGTHSRPILSDLLVMAGLVPAIQKRRRWRLPGRARDLDPRDKLGGDELGMERIARMGPGLRVPRNRDDSLVMGEGTYRNFAMLMSVSTAPPARRTRPG